MTEESEPNIENIPTGKIPMPSEPIPSPLDGLNDEEVLEKYREMYELEYEEGRKEKLNQIIISLEEKISNLDKIINTPPFNREDINAYFSIKNNNNT